MIKDYKATILTFIQYATLPLMMWKMTWFCSNIYLFAIQFIGLIIATWALWKMNKSKINISPIPRKGSVLVDTGVYSVIRHPMYTSLLLVFIPMLSENLNSFNISIFILFFANLILKLEYEETLLLKHFDTYGKYQCKTQKVIPYLY